MDLLRFSLPNRYPSQCSPDSSSSLDGSRGGHGNPWLVSYPSPSHVSLNSNRNWATAATASAKEGLSRWLTAWRVKTRNIFLKERTLAHWILQLTKLQNRFIFCHAPRTDLILTWFTIGAESVLWDLWSKYLFALIFMLPLFTFLPRVPPLPGYYEVQEMRAGKKAPSSTSPTPTTGSVKFYSPPRAVLSTHNRCTTYCQ